MSLIRMIAALVVIYALYTLYTGGPESQEPKIREVKRIYNESLESLGFSREKLKDNYKDLEEIE